MLKYITSQNINRKSWQRLVLNSENSSIFCFDWYLDAFCIWDAIILDDYKGAIALPIRIQFGHKFLYQPSFIQQCIWFGEPPNRNQLLSLLKKHFHKIHFNTNISFENSRNRINLVLRLNDYNNIAKNYSKSVAKNIRKAQRSNIEVLQDLNQVDRVVQLYRNAYGNLNPNLDDKAYSSLTKLVLNPLYSDYFQLLVVKHNNKIIAGLLFLQGKNRLHYILGAPNEVGRKHNALSFAIDHIIKQHCNQNMILDFEGSSIPNVKAFYESFGAEDEGFYEINITVSTFLWFATKIYRRFIKS